MIDSLHILYEDDHLLAVSKPAGTVVHPTYRNRDGTLLDALYWYARDWPPGATPSIVGRLDRLTSGIVVVAKGPSAHAAMQRTLADAHARKTYLAIVYGGPPPCGEIRLPLMVDPADRRRVRVDERGASSLTRFRTIALNATPRVGLALVECMLGTGRRHQLRVHLSASGWPVVGDPVYSPPSWTEIEDGALADRIRRLDRQALHAARVAFVHPVTGGAVDVASAPPADFLALAAAAGLA